MIQLFGLSHDEFGSCNKLYKLEREQGTLLELLIPHHSLHANLFLDKVTFEKMLAMMIWEEIVSELQVQEDWV
jgi:hypothetical protein